MKPNQLATLVLRLLGIYCLIQVIPTLAVITSAVSFVKTPQVNGKENTLSDLALILTALLPFCFRLAAGILLLVRSVTWGERLIPKDNGQENITAISFEQVQVLAFAVAGIMIFADALPSLFRSIYNLINQFIIPTKHPEYQSDYIWRTALTELGTLAEAVLGLGLFFRAHGIANFWRSLRNFGTPKPPAEI